MRASSYVAETDKFRQVDFTSPGNVANPVKINNQFAGWHRRRKRAQAGLKGLE
jgi:hypothetical protein